MTADFDADRLFDLIERLVFCHSPSGAEEEIDRFLLARLAELGVEPERDAAGNIHELIALEICPKSIEYPIADDRAPALPSMDGYGLYDGT
jgi:hypothetical protein